MFAKQISTLFTLHFEITSRGENFITVRALMNLIAINMSRSVATVTTVAVLCHCILAAVIHTMILRITSGMLRSRARNRGRMGADQGSDCERTPRGSLAYQVVEP
jgi:hypothetical protein